MKFEYLCQKWVTLVCYVCRNHNTIPFLIYDLSPNRWAETVYIPKHLSSPRFLGVLFTQTVIVLILYCRPMFLVLFWPLMCRTFFDFTASDYTFVSSNFSSIAFSHIKLCVLWVLSLAAEWFVLYFLSIWPTIAILLLIAIFIY
jgi:hypothetical protein